MTSCTGSVGWGFWGFEKKQWVEFLPANERVEIQSWARPDELVRYGRPCKSSQHWKIVSLSHHIEKTFKLKKVNKSFVPEPISCFRIPIYVCEHFMNIMSISHIRIMGMLHTHTHTHTYTHTHTHIYIYIYMCVCVCVCVCVKMGNKIVRMKMYLDLKKNTKLSEGDFIRSV